ncbi:MAG: hypothetical protein WBD63_01130 [Phycisphaerae bacterium]|nr:hypothetical protein [Phycisphaerae bacterium]
MSKRKALTLKKQAARPSDHLPSKSVETLKDRALSPFPPLLLLASERLKQGGDSQFWAEIMLDLWPPLSLSRKTGTSPYVSVFRALYRMERFRRFRALCEAVGLGPCEEWGEGEDGAAEWWLHILLMPQGFHDNLWRSFVESFLTYRAAFVEVVTVASKEDRRKKDIIVALGGQIADLRKRKQVKAVECAQRRPMRPPTDEQNQIATFYENQGYNQTKTAAWLTKYLRKPVTQSRVSRAVATVNRWRKANPTLNLPQIPTRKRKVARNINPERLDLGPRTDHLAERQRDKPRHLRY